MSFAKRDITRFYYPVWYYVVRSIKEGILPFWNPFTSYGSPLLANIQACVFYPLTLILYLPDYTWAFNFYILLHLALAGFFTCFWMRDCGASRTASFVSGMAYALSGYVLSTINLTISLCALVYFPLALFTLRRALNDRRFFWKAITALVLLLQYLAGDPAIFFTTLIVYVFFVGFKTLQRSLAAKRVDGGPAVSLAQIMGVFLGLGAFHYLIFFEFISQSNRAKMSFDAATMWSIQYNDLVSVFFPYFSDISIFFMDYWLRQSWLDNYYSGITVVVLAVIALLGKKKDIVHYHVFLALLGLALAIGRFSGFYFLLFKFFPFFSFIRYPVRFFFLFSFALACLAGFGFDKVLAMTENKSTRSPSDRKAFTLALGILLSVVLAIVGIRFLDAMKGEIFLCVQRSFEKWTGNVCSMDSVMDMTLPVIENSKRTVLLVLMTVCGVFCAFYFKPRKWIIAIFFGLLVFADVIGTNIIELRIDGSFLRKPGKNVEVLLKDKGLFRYLASQKTLDIQLQPKAGPNLAATRRTLMDALTPNMLMVFRISDVSGYDSIHLSGPVGINRNRILDKDPEGVRYYDMLNMKYLASPNESIGAAYTLASKTETVNLFLNDRVLPRAFLVRGAEVVPDKAEILRKLISKEYDPEDTLYLEKNPALAPETRTQGPEVKENTVHITDYKPERVQMEVVSSDKPWLFFSDTFYPGWSCRVDGKLAEIFKANYAFRAVHLSPGPHKVEWKYDPILFKIGLMVTLLTGLALAFYFARTFHGGRS